jgi:hypothetical protein
MSLRSIRATLAVDSRSHNAYITGMARTNFESTTVERAIEDAERVGATSEEARRIHSLVKANTNPQEVRGFELKFGRDSTDNEALWVYLLVENDLNPSTQKISRLNEQAKKVRSALLNANLRFWPYVDVRGRS